MKKLKYLFIFIFMFVVFSAKTNALTIRETIDGTGGFSKLEEGSIIIGITRFSPNSIVTASRAASAGADDAVLYVNQNGSTDGYEKPGVYYYVDSYVGWFYLDSNNNASIVTDENVLEELSKLDIYYVDNVEKILEIDYKDNNIDLDTLPDGVVFKNNKLFVNATISKFEFMTNENNKISYVMDSVTSDFVLDVRNCYIVVDGIITDYDSECGSEIVIPNQINGTKITGIGNNAFEDAKLNSVVISSGIKIIGENAFINNIDLSSVILNNDLEIIYKNAFSGSNKLNGDLIIPASVTSIGENAFGSNLSRVDILGKASEDDFVDLGLNPFGNAKLIIFENKIDVQEVTLNETSLILDIGENFNLVANIKPIDATNKKVIWSSSDNNIVVVNDGQVVAKSAGNAVITALVDGKIVTCNVTVNRKLTYSYLWEKIDSSIVDEHYLYIVSSNGDKVSGNVKIVYNNGKSKEHIVPSTGIKIVKSAVSLVEVLNVS